MLNAKTYVPINADYIIILGTKVDGKHPSPTLQERIDAASDYLKKNPDTIAIASGQKGPNERISEAQAIKDALVSKGISKSRIKIEDRSSRTVENISFSERLLPKKIKNGKGIVVSNYFHIYRARLIAKDQGFALYSIPAKTPPEEAPKWYFREYLAISKYYIERATNQIKHF
ncbi:YdcF family protein [Bacillus mexicanus]|uniref:YdcF family protein n=1 Tax=Bacillus mexicanus TaxID=2834415 RepID=UPI003D1CE69A